MLERVNQKIKQMELQIGLNKIYINGLIWVSSQKHSEFSTKLKDNLCIFKEHSKGNFAYI